MFIEDTITITAPADDVYDLAWDVLSWPLRLPHYRRVTLLKEEGDHRVVEMSASRDGIPVSWISIQKPLPEMGRIIFRHIGGPTTGMYVEWIIKENATEQGKVTQVRITHEFEPHWGPVFGAFAAKYIVGRFFVHNIASKTLKKIKEIAEIRSSRATGLGSGGHGGRKQVV